MNTSNRESIVWWGAAAILLGMAFYATSRAPKKPNPEEAWKADTVAVDTLPGFNEIARSNRGRVIWYGNDLEPPYVFSFHAEVPGLFVNGLPSRIEDVFPPPQAELTPRMRKRWELDQQMGQLADSLRLRGTKVREIASIVARAYASRIDLVESARPTLDGKVVVNYREWKFPHHISFVPLGGDSARVLKGVAVRQFAESAAQSLEQGGVLVFGQGVLSIPASRAGTFLTEARQIRDGLVTTSPLIRDPVLASQIAHPLSMDQYRITE